MIELERQFSAISFHQIALLKGYPEVVPSTFWPKELSLEVNWERPQMGQSTWRNAPALR